ncbi:unnamed protein product [Amoebophrya sp. A25]|nr:unnamed protein product [Amoebophrya sp. A25]|eukprot:GSA25T00005087001.1
MDAHSAGIMRGYGRGGRPPDRGSFPLDHWNDCTPIMSEYMACLGRNRHDNNSCRYITRQYLQCRMDHNLMHKEELAKLGFRESDVEVECPPRQHETAMQRKQRQGFLAGHTALVLEERSLWRWERIFSMGKWEDWRSLWYAARGTVRRATGGE